MCRVIARVETALASPGIYDIPFADYFAIEAWGSSSLKAMRTGPPALVPWERANPSPDTPPTELGTACHAKILTPAIFRVGYMRLPEDAPEKPTEAMLAAAKPGPSSIARQKWWSDFNAAAVGMMVKKAAFMDQVDQIEAAFLGNDSAHDALFEAVGVERSVLWNHECGEPLKGRPDFWTRDHVYDLKVSRHAVAGKVALMAHREGWMHQLAHNRDGLRANGHQVKGGRLVVIGPKPPQSLRVFTLEVKDATLDMLAMENDETVKAMRACRLANDWPGVPQGWKKIEMPPAALAEMVVGMDFSETQGD